MLLNITILWIFMILRRKSELGNSHAYYLHKYITLFYKTIQQTTQMTLVMLRWLKSKTAKNAHFKDLWSTDVIAIWCSIFHWLQQKVIKSTPR